MASDAPGSSSPPPSMSEKPLPAIRPGTSGTENLLVAKRRNASQRYQKAQRAERTYIAKKRTAAARADYVDAKHHFRQAGHHLREGVKMVFGIVKAAPYVLGERRNATIQRREEIMKAKQAEKRRKLEEKLANEKADNSTVRGSEEGDSREEA